MPVPKASRQVKQRSLASAVGFDPTRVSGAPFGGAKAADLAIIGRGLTDVGLAADIVQERNQNKIDTVRARSGLNSATDKMRESWDIVSSLRGKEAIGSYNVLKNELDKIREEGLKNAETEREKAMFAASFDARRNQILNNAITKESKELENYERETKDAENFGFVQDAIRNRNNPEDIVEFEEGLIANTDSSTKGRGVSIRKSARINARNNMYGQMMDAALKDSVEDGRAFLDKYGNKMDARLEAEYKDKIENAESIEATNNRAAEISGSNLSFREKLKLVDSEKDPRIDKKSLRANLKMREQEDKYSKQTESFELFKTLYDQIKEKPNEPIPNNGLVEKDWIRANTLRNDILSNNRRAQGDKDYFRLSALSYDGLREVNLDNYVGKIRHQDLTALNKRQRDRSGEFHASSQSEDKWVEGLMDSAGIKGFKKRGIARDRISEELLTFPLEERKLDATRNLITARLTNKYNAHTLIWDKNKLEAAVEGIILFEPDSKPKEVPRQAKWDTITDDKGDEYQGYVLRREDGSVSVYAATVGDTTNHFSEE